MADVLHAEIRAEATGGETIERVRRETRELHEEISKLHGAEREASLLGGRLAETMALVAEHSEGLRDHLFEFRDAMGESGETAGELIPMLGALGAAASVTGLVDMARETAEARTELNAMAETLGLTVSQLQAYRLVAQEADVSVEDMQGSILKLDRAMETAASGKNKDAAAIFQHMGISLRGAHGELKSVNDVLPLIAESLTKTHDTTLRNAVAMQLFGRSGAYLIPFLKEAAENMGEMQKRSDELNASLSPEDNENIERFKNSWIELDTAFGGLKDTITADLAPVLTPILHDITGWVAANRAGIGTTITSDFKALSDAVRQVDWKTLGSDMSVVGHVLNEGAQDVGGWTRILEVMAGLAVLKFAWSAAQPVWEMGKIGVEAVKLAWTLSHELAEAWGRVGEKAEGAATAEEVAATTGGGASLLKRGGAKAASGAAAAGAAEVGSIAPAAEVAEVGASVGAAEVAEVGASVGAVGVGLAALPALAAATTLVGLERFGPSLLRFGVHMDGTQDVDHANARGYTGPTKDQTHAVDHAYGRHEAPRAAYHTEDPFDELEDALHWIASLQNRRYDADSEAIQKGELNVKVSLDLTNPQQPQMTATTEQSGALRVDNIDVGRSFPMGYR